MAIQVITSNVAERLNLKSKGRIKEGYDADLLLFDENIEIKKVFINGEEKYNSKC